jgi:hypothetical protein
LLLPRCTLPAVRCMLTCATLHVVFSARLHFFACFDGLCECTSLILNQVKLTRRSCNRATLQQTAQSVRATIPAH